MDKLIQLMSDLESNTTYYKTRLRNNPDTVDLDEIVITLKGNINRINDEIEKIINQ